MIFQVYSFCSHDNYRVCHNNKTIIRALLSQAKASKLTIINWFMVTITSQVLQSINKSNVNLTNGRVMALASQIFQRYYSQSKNSTFNNNHESKGLSKKQNILDQYPSNSAVSVKDIIERLFSKKIPLRAQIFKQNPLLYATCNKHQFQLSICLMYYYQTQTQTTINLQSIITSEASMQTFLQNLTDTIKQAQNQLRASTQVLGQISIHLQQVSIHLKQISVSNEKVVNSFESLLNAVTALKNELSPPISLDPNASQRRYSQESIAQRQSDISPSLIVRRQSFQEQILTDTQEFRQNINWTVSHHFNKYQKIKEITRSDKNFSEVSANQARDRRIEMMRQTQTVILSLRQAQMGIVMRKPQLPLKKKDDRAKPFFEHNKTQ